MTIIEKFGIEVDGEVPDCQPKEVPADVYDRYRAMMKQTENFSVRFWRIIRNPSCWMQTVSIPSAGKTWDRLRKKPKHVSS